VETPSTKPEETVIAEFKSTPDQESPEEAKIAPLPSSKTFPLSTFEKALNSNPLRVQHLAIPSQKSDESKSKADCQVTDIFTTSFTHSASLRTNRSLSKLQCKSAQELPKSPIVVIKQKLIRSYSDTPPRLSVKSHGSSTSLKIPSCLQSKMYRDDCVSQILDYLFIGSIEVAYNEPKLCRLKIDSLVDISNLSSAQVPSSKKLHCPCLCGNDSRHFRSRLIIRVDDDDKEDIEQYFSEINKFIDGARKCGKNVLIFSYHGNSRAPAAAIQYLMSHEGFLIRQAYNLVKNQRPAVEINQGFQNTLEALEHRLFPEAKPSVPFSNDYLNIADPQAIKCAWVDCSDM
jgi:dual specificity MAP kinase phosphatase